MTVPSTPSTTGNIMPRPLPPTASSEEHFTGLTAREISNLSSSQLVDIIRAVRLPVLRDEVLESMASYDRKSLERLVLATQRCRENKPYMEVH
jgi:hypothetical protein